MLIRLLRTVLPGGWYSPDDRSACGIFGKIGVLPRAAGSENLMKPLLYLFAATLPVWGQLCPSIISSTGSPTINCLSTREFGQPQLRVPLTSTVPNLVEGRELNFPLAVAFDRSVTPPIVYVADTFNNRVLAWKNSTSLTKGNFADMVIGQVDLLSTNPQGPSQQGSILPSGLSVPTGLAVDSAGNLYVADSGNNRILRYPAPFAQTLTPLQVDLVIGQANANSGSSGNQGQSTPTASTLTLSSNGNTTRTGMAFDSAGNLWTTDVGNNRVLRFPVGNLTANKSMPAADTVLGQFDFVSNAQPSGSNQTQTNKLATVAPVDLTFDQTGNLYVADSYARVLFFSPPFSNGISAIRVLGIPAAPAQGQTVTYPNQYSLGGTSGNIVPQCVVTVGNNLFVCDSGANRVVYFDVPANWPAATTAQPSPPLIGSTIGQGPSFATGTVNRGLPQQGGIGIDGNALNAPLGAAFNGTELWIADSGNNRILGFPQSGSLNFASPTRVLGQTDFEYYGENLVEGREVHFFPAAQPVTAQGGTLTGAAVAVDTNSTPPHLYVADSQNNRILGFKDANNILPGQTADLVIGQQNLSSILPNWPNNGPSSGKSPVNPTATGLYNPSGVAVDANGNLLVADSGNGRVLRFAAPFAQAGVSGEAATLVLGQLSFTQYDPTPRAQTMSTPYGIALFSDGSLAVSDAAQDRVMVFQRPSGGDFTNGQAAAHVFGQQDFSGVGVGSGIGNLSSPRQVSIYSSAFFADQLYVADTGNNRIVLYNNARVASNGASASYVLQSGFNQPVAMVVNPTSGEIWVGDTNNNVIDRFPAYQTLIGQSSASPAQQIPSVGPLAVNFDAFGNLIVAEASNRVTFYYPQMVFRNEANFNTQGLAPGMLAHVGELLNTGFGFAHDSEPGRASLSDHFERRPAADGRGGELRKRDHAGALIRHRFGRADSFPGAAVRKHVRYPAICGGSSRHRADRRGGHVPHGALQSWVLHPESAGNRTGVGAEQRSCDAQRTVESGRPRDGTRFVPRRVRGRPMQWPCRRSSHSAGYGMSNAPSTQDCPGSGTLRLPRSIADSLFRTRRVRGRLADQPGDPAECTARAGNRCDQHGRYAEQYRRWSQ